jgi:multidrug resistance efflux pump
MIQEAEAKGVRREYDQLKALADQKVRSSDALDARQTAVEVAEARILKAQAELKMAEQQAQQAKMEVNALTIRAPRGGTVTQVRVQPGEYVAGPSSQPLMLIGP